MPLQQPCKIESVVFPLVAALSLLCNGAQAQTAEAHKQKSDAYKHLEKSKFDKAIVICDKLLKDNPKDVDARRYKAIASYHTGAIGSAVDNLKYCIKASEMYVDHLYVGDCMFSTGNYAEAISAYKRALQLEPNQKSAYEGLARTYHSAGHAKYAKQVVEKAKQWGHKIELPDTNRQLAGTGNYGS